MQQYKELLQDIKKILIDLAIKGEFDQCDMNGFDTDKLLPAFRKHSKKMKDESVVFSTDENIDDPSVYGVQMVRLSTALGKY
jgi:hypothetical protein